MRRTTRRAAIAVTVPLLAASAASAQISIGQMDTFDDLSTAGWSEGLVSPNPPEVVPLGAPDDSPFLSNFSAGGFGPGSRQVMFNRDQWAGDYVSAGVTGISLLMRGDPSGASFDMRLYVQADVNFFTVGFGSTNSQRVINDGVWREYTFFLTEDAMSPVFTNGETLEQVLSNVLELRILAASFGPDAVGDNLVGAVGFDNIRAIPAPGAVLIPGVLALAGVRRRR